MTLLASSALQSLPDPTVIESPDFESLLSEVKQDILRFAPELKDAMELESEPASKIAQAIAYRVMHERHLANSQALALMLAKAMGPQLDHLGSLPFIRTSRKLLRVEDKTKNPPLPAEYENDTEYRARLQLALEGYSTAGPIGAYIYHGLAAHQDVKDIAIDAPTFSRYKVPPSVAASLPSHALLLTTDYDAGLTNPAPGDVAITVLSRKDNGKPTSDVMKAVSLRLNDDAIRPLTDRPSFALQLS
ncbi:baseplate assembly protein [Veronia nyctiphanis]|uniref:Baseplate assembly protein n=1 Tax=Veronia nyctiphanis TaxID=1278244 RepID=A0A4Q0YJP7_9GAMM|nr:baseplate J/gp47 family protein [Veronia nyctiphanis]RXJ70653.1 baseplate assembly protein [Veronia nyctiphanis]